MEDWQINLIAIALVILSVVYLRIAWVRINKANNPAHPADNRNQTTISMKKENKSSTEHDAKPLLCEVLSVKQKRQLAAEKFDVHNYVYRNICHSEMMMNDFKDGSGFGIFSGSRNYDDVYVKFDKLNERQITLLNEWGLSQHLAVAYNSQINTPPTRRINETEQP